MSGGVESFVMTAGEKELCWCGSKSSKLIFRGRIRVSSRSTRGSGGPLSERIVQEAAGQEAKTVDR